MRSDLMIEVRQARYFIAVAEELHFGRAAERLRMSQPPLSQAIQQLERQLGTRLLERTSRNVTLTESGTVLLRHCYALLATADAAAMAVAQAQAGYLGTLALGAVTSAFTQPLPAILHRFRTERPQIELRVQELDTPAGIQALLNHQLDVAVIRHGGSDRRLRVDPLRRDHLVVAVPQDHELAGNRSVDLAVLADQPWVWLPRTVSPTYHDELIAACRRAGFSPQSRHQANSIHSQLAMVACGLGVTLVPHTSTQPSQPGIAYLPLRRPHHLVELAVVRRAADPDPQPLVEHFVQCAQAVGPTE
ncbi:LysR substrate-binding domain-containing protein [Streptomyces sp. CA-135486]|uniref:LysR family transcriptional regulator n=1 Tax=Streptomyces sp. CA-135486 TaxID=3240049 RepID=UPI003D8AFA2A